MDQDGTPKSLLTGVARIQAYLRTLPDAPGVYRMLNAKGDVLYVGKALSLKKRVASYTRLAGQPYRIARMIAETSEMIFVTTASEAEALLLEANLIKRLKPRYNVLFRDDKSFPYILLRGDHAFPQIRKYRGAKSEKGIYFGPFASAGAVNSTLDTLERAFLLRSCSDTIFEGRTRPCLLYQIKRCSAPCTGRIAKPDYDALVKQAEDFLTGKSRAVQARLAKEMETASAATDFERAAQLRDRIRAMSHIHLHQGVNPQTFRDADVFAIYQEAGQSCIQVFFFRSSQNWGNRPYFPRHDREMEAADVLESFVGQFYDSRPAPSIVLLSHDIPNRELLARALATRAGHKVEIAIPSRGEKREIIQQALHNARDQMARHLAENASQRALLESVAETFGLDAPPRRIEVYDNSHIQGTNAVGAMVVAGPDGFEKAEYRKFNIKSADLKPGDDYAMMREVLTRRFTRLVKEAGTEDEVRAKWPDLVLLDGGKGQLDAACAVLTDLGVNEVAVASVAKGPDRDAGREHFYRPNQPPFRLDHKSPVLYYLQRVRDEAHRFAIGTHRKKRAKAMGVNPLDEITGVGAARKRALLAHFGSAREVANASLADIEAVNGVSGALARKIYDFFHSGD